MNDFPKEYRVEKRTFATQDLLLEYDVDGEKNYDTNKYGKFWCFVSRVIVTPKDIKTIKSVSFESEPFLEHHLNDKTLSKFETLIDEFVEKDHKQFPSIHTVSKAVKIPLNLKEEEI
jgi:hypothetical protein